MARARWYTDAERQELVRIATLPDNARGAAIQAMAARCDRRAAAISEAVRLRRTRLGLPTGHLHRPTLSADAEALIREEWDQPTLSRSVVAERAGLTIKALEDAVAELGLPTRQPVRAANNRPAPPTVRGHDPKARDALYRGRRYTDDPRDRPSRHMPLRAAGMAPAVSLMGCGTALVSG